MQKYKITAEEQQEQQWSCGVDYLDVMNAYN